MRRPGRRALLLAPVALAACAADDRSAAAAAAGGGLRPSDAVAPERAEIAITLPEIGPARRVDPPAPVDPLAERWSAWRASGCSPLDCPDARRWRSKRQACRAVAWPRLASSPLPREQVSCVLRCRLEVFRGTENEPAGFAAAEVRRMATGPRDGSEARRAAETVRRAMEDMNVELEFQIRRNLGRSSSPARRGRRCRRNRWRAGRRF